MTNDELMMLFMNMREIEATTLDFNFWESYGIKLHNLDTPINQASRWEGGSLFEIPRIWTFRS